ncbi:MAG: hypothetical protein LAQ30_03625 [Acidobacteriia bacterium]|nr:hypothetical protein [Terriglobia bacterium]
MRFFFTALLLPALAGAAIWPDAIGPYHRTSTPQTTVMDRPLWDEYGLKETETAIYENAGNRFTATAWRLQDTTGAMAAFDWQRNPKAVPSKVASLAAETPDTLLLVHGNYLLSFTGYKPGMPELDALAAGLLNVDSTALPTLPGFLPSENLVPNSERYVTGPVGLQKFDPGIPPSAAGFRLSAEAQMGVFRSPKGEMGLAIFNYPTPQIAMQKVADFEKLPGSLVKRSGPLVAVILSPPDPDAAERLLSQVRYDAAITRSEYVPTRRDNIGDLVVNAFLLIGILLAFALVSGLFVGGFRAVLLRGRKGRDLEPMIMLHLERR